MEWMDLVKGLSVPAFIGAFAMGWGACFRYVVKPNQIQIAKLETRIGLLEKKFLNLHE
jgi:hypothetical protein